MFFLQCLWLENWHSPNYSWLLDPDGARRRGQSAQGRKTPVPMGKLQGFWTIRVWTIFVYIFVWGNWIAGFRGFQVCLLLFSVQLGNHTLVWVCIDRSGKRSYKNSCSSDGNESNMSQWFGGGGIFKMFTVHQHNSDCGSYVYIFVAIIYSPFSRHPTP